MRAVHTLSLPKWRDEREIESSGAQPGLDQLETSRVSPSLPPTRSPATPPLSPIPSQELDNSDLCY
jgi:hypothetical protein